MSMPAGIGFGMAMAGGGLTFVPAGAALIAFLFMCLMAEMACVVCTTGRTSSDKLSSSRARGRGTSPGKIPSSTMDIGVAGRQSKGQLRRRPLLDVSCRIGERHGGTQHRSRTSAFHPSWAGVGGAPEAVRVRVRAAGVRTEYRISGGPPCSSSGTSSRYPRAGDGGMGAPCTADPFRSG
jgi:hypothetical protein